MVMSKLKKTPNGTRRYNMKKLKNFTLVEITMAIAIIGIGMAGVMAILPIGFNASRDAMGDNLAADAADQFLHTMAMQCTKKQPSAGDYDWADAGQFVNQIPSEKFDEASSTYNDADEKTLEDGLNWSTPFLGNIYAHSTPATSYTNGVYGIMQKTGNVVDFKAIMWVWKTDIPYYYYDGTAYQKNTVDPKYGTRLNVEISWPADKPYDQREKKYYVLEIFNKHQQ